MNVIRHQHHEMAVPDASRVTIAHRFHEDRANLLVAKMIFAARIGTRGDKEISFFVNPFRRHMVQPFPRPQFHGRIVRQRTAGASLSR